MRDCGAPGDLNDAEGLKDLGLFSSVPDAARGGKVMASAFSNSSNTSVPMPAVRSYTLDRKPRGGSTAACGPKIFSSLKGIYTCTYAN